MALLVKSRRRRCRRRRPQLKVHHKLQHNHKQSTIGGREFYPQHREIIKKSLLSKCIEKSFNFVLLQNRQKYLKKFKISFLSQGIQFCFLRRANILWHRQSIVVDRRYNHKFCINKILHFLFTKFAYSRFKLFLLS